MIPALMVYAILVSVLVFAAGRAVEEVCRLTGLATRFVWVGALVVTVALVVLAPVRPGTTDVAAPASVELAALATDAGPAGLERAESAAALELIRVVRGALDWPLQVVAPMGDGRSSAVLAVGWLAVTLGLLGFSLATLLRYRRARRSWPLREVAGMRVRVAPSAGPAVVGIVRPEIVVPEWLLGAPEEEQGLVVLHEREHLRARDPSVLAAGCLLTVLLPWNPIAWWMLFRLRLAVELDCDGRVLRGGVRPQTYGSVLIDMAGRGAGLPLGAAALAGSPSTLNRRILAMTRRLPRFATLRATGLALIGSAALLAACDTELPTAAEVEAMDVATAETQAQELRLLPHAQEGVVYMIDGEEVSAEEAHALLGDRIARIEILRASVEDSARVLIRTRSGDGIEPGEVHRVVTAKALRAPGTEKEGVREVRILRPSRTAEAAEGATAPVGTPLDFEGFGGQGFDGLLVIDGVVTESSTLRTLRPEQIESIEVIKGDAATRLYDDPRATRGVIHITTRGA